MPHIAYTASHGDLVWNSTLEYSSWYKFSSIFSAKVGRYIFMYFYFGSSHNIKYTSVTLLYRYYIIYVYTYIACGVPLCVCTVVSEKMMQMRWWIDFLGLTFIEVCQFLVFIWAVKGKVVKKLYWIKEYENLFLLKEFLNSIGKYFTFLLYIIVVYMFIYTWLLSASNCVQIFFFKVSNWNYWN